MVKDKEDLIKKIKIALIDRDMAKGTLASMVGVHQSTISHLLNNGIGSVKLIKKIAVVLDLEIDFKNFV